jgi:hypothetical protein
MRLCLQTRSINLTRTAYEASTTGALRTLHEPIASSAWVEREFGYEHTLGYKEGAVILKRPFHGKAVIFDIEKQGQGWIQRRLAQKRILNVSSAALPQAWSPIAMIIHGSSRISLDEAGVFDSKSGESTAWMKAIRCSVMSIAACNRSLTQ